LDVVGSRGKQGGAAEGVCDCVDSIKHIDIKFHWSCESKLGRGYVYSWNSSIIQVTCVLQSYRRLTKAFSLHCIALHCIALLCIALHCIALHCFALHCIALHCILVSLCIALTQRTLCCNVKLKDNPARW
jgi:hypothetical protein